MAQRAQAVQAIVLDVDSTLCGIEGIDWLAARRGAGVAAKVVSLTERAMRGEIALEGVYAERLSMVTPSAADVDALARAYVKALAPGARLAISAWRERGIRVVLVSGGIRSAILQVASHLGLQDADVYAVAVEHDPAGLYASYDRMSPLAVATGKRDIVAELDLKRAIIAVGDGSTDLAMREVVDCFAAFTGFVARPAVVAAADFVVTSFDELNDLVGSYPWPASAVKKSLRSARR